MPSIRATAAAGRRRSPCRSAGRSRRPRSASLTDLGQPFATWSLAKLADYLVAEGVAARGGRPLSSAEDVEALERSRLRAQEESDPRAVRARRGGRGGYLLWTSSGRSTCSPNRAG